MRKLLVLLSYAWTLFADIVIMLSVASMIIQFSMDNDISKGWAWGIGMAAAIAAFAHLKFRHQLRKIGLARLPVVKPILSEADHKEALEAIDRLSFAQPGSAAHDHMQVLTALVSEYENKYFDGLKEKHEPLDGYVASTEEKKPEYHFIKYGA